MCICDTQYYRSYTRIGRAPCQPVSAVFGGILLLFLIGGTRNFPARFSTGPVAARPRIPENMRPFWFIPGAVAADSDARGGPERADSEALFKPRRPAPPHQWRTHVRTRTRERRGRRTAHCTRTHTHTPLIKDKGKSNGGSVAGGREGVERRVVGWAGGRDSPDRSIIIIFLCVPASASALWKSYKSCTSTRHIILYECAIAQF